VYTSGDEAELFLNGRSLGRKKKEPFEYRLRWDDVKYEPGELRVIAYRKGRRWAEDVMKTAGAAARLILKADRARIKADGEDLSFVTLTIADRDGALVPRSNNRIQFEMSGPGEIVATDNGDPTNLESFQAQARNAFNGLCLVVIRSQRGRPGVIKLRAQSPGLGAVEALITSDR
jgi:beta-galactosidase